MDAVRFRRHPSYTSHHENQIFNHISFTILFKHDLLSLIIDITDSIYGFYYRREDTERDAY